MAETSEILAEMVASVLSIAVAPGDKVAAGEVLILLESMKMEIPVLAEADGTVLEIRVVPGDVIQEGDVLAVLEH
ncbi:MAG: biotin/lipoyl-binding carrier protein [Microbacterium sp.]|nr:MAG: biotin/lipoyl-binding carrier protein [Microbacterium sp.]